MSASKSKGKRSKTTYEGKHDVRVENRQINFATDGSPYGDQVNQFMNYICMIVRDWVPCNLHERRDIKHYDNQVRDKMWAEIKVIT
jgi:hypothetical protein